jgi:hypothetical protein
MLGLCLWWMRMLNRFFMASGYNFIDVGFPGKFSVKVDSKKLCGYRQGNAPAMDE